MRLLGYVNESCFYCVDCVTSKFNPEQIEDGTDSKEQLISGVYHSNWDSEEAPVCDVCKEECD